MVAMVFGRWNTPWRTGWGASDDDAANVMAMRNGIGLSPMPCADAAPIGIRRMIAALCDMIEANTVVSR